MPRHSKQSAETIAEQYALDVLSGKVIACKMVIQACQRHFDDLENASRKGWIFDRSRGELVINFIAKFITHTSGQWAGKPFILEPWQQFIVMMIFGWIKKDGRRRFTKSYIEIPKKNGKTALAAALSIVMMLLDGEENAEIYFAATKRDQANICFDESKRMVEKNKFLKERLKVMTSAVVDHTTNSSARALSSDRDGIDGKRPFFTVIDEYHQHKTSEISDELESAGASRRSPLHFTITTAGFNVNGPCHQLQKMCREVLTGKKRDDSLFTIIYTADEGDDWRKVETWKKANPNYNVSFSGDSMRSAYVKAKNLGGQKEVEFKTKRLNIWVKSSSVWINDEKWMACREIFTERKFNDRQVWMGMDLASVSDFTALTRLTEIDGKLYVMNNYWLPEDTYHERLTENERHIYRDFVEDGWITLTPGNVTDFDSIRKLITGYSIGRDGSIDVVQDCIMTKSMVQILGYDSWNSSHLAGYLAHDGVNINPVAQTTGKLNQATVEVEKRALEGTIIHNGDPVLRWMMGNVQLRHDHNGNKKPDKEKSEDKIDGVISMVMAINEWMIDTHSDRLPDELEVILI